MTADRVCSRRDFLKRAALGGAVLLVSCSSKIRLMSGEVSEKTTRQGDFSPSEDLLREHGVLKRLLLVYRHYIRRFDSGRTIQYQSLSETAHLIRAFMEDSHEKFEEDHLFPRFRKAGVLVELVDTLELQHQHGRMLTDRILAMPRQEELRSHLLAFVRMHEPHEAREDTVLFPAIQSVVSRKEFRDIGRRFEEQEHFGKIIDRITSIEKRLGLYDLSQFTPAGSPAAGSSRQKCKARKEAAAVIPLLPPQAICEPGGSPHWATPSPSEMNGFFSPNSAFSGRSTETR